MSFLDMRLLFYCLVYYLLLDDDSFFCSFVFVYNICFGYCI